MGVWSQWFILIISVTGIWYLVERWGGAASYPSKGKATSELAIAEPTNPSLESFNLMLKQVERLYPELSIELIRFPFKAGQGVAFTGDAEAILVRPRANLISFDPETTDLLTLNKGVDLSVHARISEAADPIHFGTFAGMPSKVIYFIFGVLLSGLSLTGIYIFGMRVTKKPKSQTANANYYWQGALSKMKKGKWLSYFLLIICAVLTFIMFTGLIYRL